tara:strand:- start:13388 stop:15259 length:1872 start_codon:yes stop_codon:yes gene_type:complete
MQLELRRLFQIAPPNVALRQSLERIGRHFGGVYIAMHGCPAGEPLSEEWQENAFSISDDLRERVNEAVFGAMGGDAARCLRLSGGGGRIQAGAVIVVATMYNEELTPAGGAAMVAPCPDRDDAITLLGAFESMVGFVSLLASSEIDLQRVMQAGADDASSQSKASITSAARAGSDLNEDPWRVGWDLVGDLQARHGFDQVALGVVTPNAHCIEVKVVSGMDQIRAGNPGVRRIRAAMEEALDRGGLTLWAGRDRPSIENVAEAPDDPRLHRQWSESIGGDPVATIPLRAQDQIVGVVTLRHSKVEPLRLAKLAALQKELEAWGGLLPLVDRAARSVTRHAIDASRIRVRRVMGTGWWRTIMTAAIALVIVCVAAFAEVDDIVDAPARLMPSTPRVVSTPRDARLISLHAHVGESVVQGQLLAVLDLQDEQLAAKELGARLDVLAVEIEVARANNDFGAMYVSRARQRATEAELQIVEAQLADAQILAPIDGRILDSTVQPRVGDRLAVGEHLFTIGGARVCAELRIPDRDLPSTRQLSAAVATFEPYAHPGTELELGVCDVPPTAQIVDDRAVYLVRAEVLPEANAALRPGMEGVARVRLGRISIWTACSRPVIRWLRRSTWL